MRFDHAIDEYLTAKQAYGDIASPHTIGAYRDILEKFAREIGNRDPAKVGKRDVEKFLARWTNPPTRAHRHAIVNSFFEWAVQEELTKYNPVDPVRRPRIKHKPPTRLTHAEIIAIIDAAEPVRRDRWAVNIMLYTGARNEEVRRLRGIDLRRDGYIRLHGKGDKTRWVPVLPALAPIVAEILAQIDDDQYVLPGRRSSNPPHHTVQHDSQTMLSRSALQRQARRIGKRAGLALDLHPHLLRHAFGDAVTRYAGGRVAQALMGHESIQTTIDFYVDNASLDELVASLRGFDYRPSAGLLPSNHHERARDVTDAS